MALKLDLKGSLLGSLVFRTDHAFKRLASLSKEAFLHHSRIVSNIF